MVPEIETPSEPTAFSNSIVRGMTQLYSGEATHYQPRADKPALRAVAIRADDFREDRGNWPKVFHYGRRTKRAVVFRVFKNEVFVERMENKLNQDIIS